MADNKANATFRSETPEDARERLEALSAAEKEGMRAASEGQLTVDAVAAVLTEDEIAARSERLEKLNARPLGAKSHTERADLDREARSVQDEENRPVVTADNVGDLNRQYAEQAGQARSSGEGRGARQAAKGRSSHR